MATLSSTTNEKVIGIKTFLGLHESYDGDNNIKMGEASICENFRITNEGHLKKRDGCEPMYNLKNQSTTAAVKGLWHGYVSGKRVFLAACDGRLLNLWDDSTDIFRVTPEVIGSIDCTNDITFVPFEGKLYLLNGVKYMTMYYASSAWHLDDVSSGSSGYRPLVTITVPPQGGGETLEQVNKLNGMRRCWISPDGSSDTFHLPETGVQSIDWVKDLSTGTILVAGTDYSKNLSSGTVTFTNVPPLGVNTYEIAWTVNTNFASTVAAMKFAELYSGTQDTRLFIYGDGSNKAFYSGLDYNGTPRGDYFPDLNEIAIGNTNTPITGLIRHYSRLLAFKSDSTYTIDYGVVTLDDSSLTPAFYATPVNRNIGNEAPGQLQLVLNSPRSFAAGNLYEWKNGSTYAGNITVDERQAKRISDRIYKTLATFDFKTIHTYDDNLHSTYYIINDGDALVHNYVADAWFTYTGLNISRIIEFNGTVYIGTLDGRLMDMNEEYTEDDGVVMDCRWESGSMDFGVPYMRKYSALMWVGLKPELNSEVIATAETDKSDENAVVVVQPEYNSDKPQIKRVKIKVKKFTHMKLVLRCFGYYKKCTVCDVEIKVRSTSYAK